MSLVYGPNYLLNSYATPNVTTRQTGEFFRFAYEHGMVGVNFRSYTFSWAAHGPMAYMHHRLLWNPELEIETIRQEYFSAFGPAAADVEQYFDYWENYAGNRPPVRRSQPTIPGVLWRDSNGFEGTTWRIRRRSTIPAEAILAKALEAARKDPLPEFAQRVEFLQAGLKHALLSTRLQEFLDFESPSCRERVGPNGSDKTQTGAAGDASTDSIPSRSARTCLCPITSAMRRSKRIKS